MCKICAKGVLQISALCQTCKHEQQQMFSHCTHNCVHSTVRHYLSEQVQ